MPAIYVTARNRYGYSVGSTVTVTDAIAATAAANPAWGVPADSVQAQTTTATGPSTETVDRALTVADASARLICAAARTFTVNPGMGFNFGPAAFGAGVVTFAAGATVAGQPPVTINDNRTSGAANPACALVCVGENAYNVVGSKA